jgi:hypothetical protein
MMWRRESGALGLIVAAGRQIVTPLSRGRYMRYRDTLLRFLLGIVPSIKGKKKANIIKIFHQNAQFIKWAK